MGGSASELFGRWPRSVRSHSLWSAASVRLPTHQEMSPTRALSPEAVHAATVADGTAAAKGDSPDASLNQPPTRRSIGQGDAAVLRGDPILRASVSGDLSEAASRLHAPPPRRVMYAVRAGRRNPTDGGAGEPEIASLPPPRNSPFLAIEGVGQRGAILVERDVDQAPRSTTPGRGTRARTASAPRSATPGSPGSGPPLQRAA